MRKRFYTLILWVLAMQGGDPRAPVFASLGARLAADPDLGRARAIGRAANR